MKCIYTNRNQKTAIYTYLSRRSLMKLIGLSAIGMGLGISAYDLSNADSAAATEIKKGSKMESSKSTIKTRIPTLDAAVPAETSTTTFALG